MTAYLTTADQLFAAVIAAPADDAPRLALADWFRENGEEERAEFIEVQVELARMERWAATRFMVLPESREGQYIDALRRRERELLRQSYESWVVPTIGKAAWCGACAGCGSFDGNHYPKRQCESCNGKGRAFEFRRGFVHTVRCTLALWLAHGPTVVRGQPVERVEITDKQPYGSGDRWTWCDARRVIGERGASARMDLPGEIWDEMKRIGLLPKLRNPLYVVGDESLGAEFVDSWASANFPAEATAREALSAACLSLARATQPPPAPPARPAGTGPAAPPD